MLPEPEPKWARGPRPTKLVLVPRACTRNHFGSGSESIVSCVGPASPKNELRHALGTRTNFVASRRQGSILRPAGRKNDHRQHEAHTSRTRGKPDLGCPGNSALHLSNFPGARTDTSDGLGRNLTRGRWSRKHFAKRKKLKKPMFTNP